LVGAASLAAALLVGCGDNDPKPTSSNAGESCVRTADCAGGLICVANVCYKTAPVASGGAAGTSTTPVGPLLGGEGESCNSRRDCTEGLGCFNNRCTASAQTGDGGATGGTGIQLGARGESCRVNGDCGKPLVCMPSATSGTGVCDLAEFGVTVTGMTCTGECLTAADCCQFPVALHEPDLKSCEDIDDKISTLAVDCDAPATPVAKKLCFEKDTYCACAAKTWSCSDSNSCVYGVACVDGVGLDVPTGCPSYARIRTLSTLTCNPDTLKCVGPTAAKGCTTDAKCEGEQVADSTTLDLCTAGECTCHAGDKKCYRKCARDIDCGQGQSCDTKKTKLCVPAAACSTDSECAIAHHDLAYVCDDSGTCAKSCNVDRDCSGTGLDSPFTGATCVDGFCASALGTCTPDTQCPALLGGAKPFCVAAPAGDVSPVSSAVTD
jgi:hypothetical protein